MSAAGSLLASVFALATSVVQAQTVLTSDVGVTLTATPTTNLVPGQPIDLTMTVTNYGPNPIPVVEVSSSLWVTEITPISFDQSECFLVVSVLDGATPAYFMSWVIAGLPGEPVFAVGETLTCHFSFSLTASAPASMPFSFGLPSFITDLNPSNDTGTVTLRRAPAPPPTPVPALSTTMIWLLTALLGVSTGIAHRRRRVF
jgi:hypothetical protein